MLVFALVEAVAAALQLRAFGLADFHVAEIGLELSFVDRRSHFGALVQTVADLQAPGAIDVALHKFGIHALLDNDAAGGGAALAGGSEAAPDAAFDGKVEVGVVQHDHWILAAQFQRAMLETLGGGGADDAADRGRSGQRWRGLQGAPSAGHPRADRIR